MINNSEVQLTIIEEPTQDYNFNYVPGAIVVSDFVGANVQELTKEIKVKNGDSFLIAKYKIVIDAFILGDFNSSIVSKVNIRDFKGTDKGSFSVISYNYLPLLDKIQYLV